MPYPLSGTARSVAATLLGVGKHYHAPDVALEAVIVAAIGETAIGTNPNTYGYNGVCCWGVLQGGTDQWPNPHDITGQAMAFFTGRGPQGQTDFHYGAINLANQGVTDPVEIAVRVEVPSIWPACAYCNGYPGGAAGLAADARSVIEQLFGGVLPVDPGAGTGSGSQGAGIINSASDLINAIEADDWGTWLLYGASMLHQRALIGYIASQKALADAQSISEFTLQGGR